MIEGNTRHGNETIVNSVYLSFVSDPGTIIVVPCVSLNYSTSCLILSLFVFSEHCWIWRTFHVFSDILVSLIRHTWLPCSLLVWPSCSLWKCFSTSGKNAS